MEADFGCAPRALRFDSASRAAGFEQVEGADDVGVDEIARAGDGAVHVRFRRQVHDVRDGVLSRRPAGRRALSRKSTFSKTYFGMPGDLLQIFQLPGVGQAIEIDQPA